MCFQGEDRKQKSLHTVRNGANGTRGGGCQPGLVHSACSKLTSRPLKVLMSKTQSELVGFAEVSPVLWGVLIE